MNNLNRRAMLVSLNISVWQGHFKDKSVTQEITTTKQAENDAGSWWTYLIPPRDLKPIVNAADDARNLMYKLTLPWNDNGVRILPSKMFLDFNKQMREKLNKYDEAVEEFIKQYPQIIEHAKKRLGKLPAKRIPEISEIKNKFGYSLNIYPLPDAGDFRAEVDESVVEEIKNKITSSITTASEKAINKIWQQLYELVEKVENTLSDPNKKFKNSLITNLSEFCALMPKLDITEDDNLEKIRQEVMDKIAKMYPDTLREAKVIRQNTAKAARELKEKIKDYLL